MTMPGHPNQLYEASTPMLPPDTPALPHSADDVWEERRNAEGCAKLRDLLWHFHPLEAA